MSSSENENNTSDEEGRKVLQRLEEKASKKVQKWSKKMTKDFIVDLQSHDCLWDVSQSSFSDRDERELFATLQISTKVPLMKLKKRFCH